MEGDAVKATATRQRLVQVFRADDGDEPMDAVVRRFWSRAKPLRAGDGGAVKGEGDRAELAAVVDLAAARAARELRSKTSL
jgi:hypothetical protein